MRNWNFMEKDGTINDTKIHLPLHWGCRKGEYEDVRVIPDVFTLDFPTIDLIFAVMASCQKRNFLLITKHKARQWRYFESVKRRGAVAGPKYGKELRAHFKKYKMKFTEGYSLPEPPTPELRAIYDSAAKRERRPEKTCGRTLHAGFSGREYHWRSWPLDNVGIRED